MTSWTVDTPYLAPEDYKTRFDAPCIYFPNYKMQDWFLGTGIKPSDHPLAWRIEFGGCGHCQSNNVLVIAAQYSVHPFSGDLYWDYEIVCNECGKFTTRSYSEN